MAKIIDDESVGKVLKIASSSNGDELINKIRDFTSKFEGNTNNVPENNVWNCRGNY